MDDAIREPLGIRFALLALPGVRIHPASGILELVSFLPFSSPSEV